jgi:putative transposase
MIPCQMPTPQYFLAKFEEHRFYHVICKSIADRKLFPDNISKSLFLDRYDHYLSDFVNTYSYCILINHIHFLIQPKSIDDISQLLRQYPPELLTITQKRFLLFDQINMFHELIEQQFNRLFISYVKRYNKRESKIGHLFLRPFRRIMIEKDSYLRQLVIYIHANPLKHNIIKDFPNYKWSAYKSILSDAPTHLCRQQVLDWFGDKENFIKLHQEQISHYYQHPYWDCLID